MSYLPSQQLSTPFEDFAGYWLKTYVQGTTSPLSMATDSTGSTLLAKAEVSSGGLVEIGFIKTTGNAIFQPYLNAPYDAYLFPTSSEADVNDTTNAIKIADNVDLQATETLLSATFTKNFDTVALMVASTTLSVGEKVFTGGYLTKGDGGDNFYEIVGAGTGTDDGGQFIDLATHQAKGLFPQNIYKPEQWGTSGDGVVNDTTLFQTLLTTGFDVIATKTYLVTDLVMSTNGQKLSGGGMLKLVGSSGTGNQVLDVTADDTKITNITFDGNQGTGSPAFGRALVHTGDNNYVADCIFQNTDITSLGGHGLSVFGGGSIAERCQAINCGYSGFKNFGKAGATTTWRDCQSDGHHVKGFLHNGDSKLLLMYNCRAQSNVTNIEENLLIDAGVGFLLDKIVVEDCVFEDNPNNDPTGNGAKFALVTEVFINRTRFEQDSTAVSTVRMQEGPTDITIQSSFFAKNLDGVVGGPADIIRIYDTTIGATGGTSPGGGTTLDGIDAGRVILERVHFINYATIAIDLEGVDQFVSCVDCTFERDTTGNAFQWSGSGAPTTAGALVVTGETFVGGGNLTASSNNTAIIAIDTSRQIFEKASIPSSLAWTVGDFVRNTGSLSPDGNNMVLTGWRRLTTGSGHVLNTDWVSQYVSTATPAN